MRARRRREEAVLPVPRCVARPGARNGPQKAAPSAAACSRWALLASDDASEPTAASDGSGAARKGAMRFTLAYSPSRVFQARLASNRQREPVLVPRVQVTEATEARRPVALTSCVSTPGAESSPA